MRTVEIYKLTFLLVNFWVKAVTGASAHIMTGRYIPPFSLNSLIFVLSFGEIFSYFATLWKWYCLTFWIGKKSRLHRQFFQYSAICHSSKYTRLALTDFNKNRVFYRNCMWLQLSKIKKQISKETRENSLSILLFVLMLTKKHWRFPLSARRLLELSSYALVQS